MKRTAVFPGSFDPITIGHQEIIKRALPLFDEIIVAIGINTNKKYMFTLETRKKWLERTFGSEPKIKVKTYEGLTVEFCRSVNASFILRGLRNPADFEYERNIAQMNHAIANGIETICLITSPEHSAINSTIVRDIIAHKGNAKPFVPNEIDLNDI
jgi:pantetheine-phosphate adenylyltransferase